MGSQEEIMCITCERELWGEHRALESEFFEPCKTCSKFPGTSSEGTCYHCFAILSDHFKSGQRLSRQNRPTGETGTYTILPLWLFLRQV